MARIIGLAFLLIILVLGLFFGVLNADPVVLNYYFGRREMPLAAVVALALLAGALLGAFAALGAVLRLRRQLAKSRRELKTAEKELLNLRSIPIKDER